LKYLFNENPFTQSETDISIKEITVCEKCFSNETLCWFHAESLKSSIVTDVQNWIKDAKKIQETKENFR
jgi:hypothetical protein